MVDNEVHETMVIRVHEDTEAAILTKVERGPYKDADEVIREALKSLDLQEFRRSIAEGIAEVERGGGFLLTPELLDEIEHEAGEIAGSGRPIRPHVLP